MTVTETYSGLHRKFTEAAERHGLVPSDVRVLVAVAELGGVAVSNEIEQVFGASYGQATMVRRSLLTLYKRGLVEGVSSLDGGRRRPGTRTRVSLQGSGAQIAAEVLG